MQFDSKKDKQISGIGRSHVESAYNFQTCNPVMATQNDYEAWFEQGNKLLNTAGHRKEALTCYDKALQLKPDYYEAWYQRGLALYKLGY